ncbi:putative PEP-binding protein [Bradyrhizobium canariense]|nr:putative PEP-binding protein [Bradyrhizobium canariense]
MEVSLCGDAAADTRLTAALIATGLTILSVSPIAVARLKAAIAKVRS